MNKNGHLWITQCVSGELLPKHRFWLKLGCITPDLLFHTFLSGHTWEKTFDRNSIRMERLWDGGRMSWWSCFRLGYLLHYVEDYFTYPHSKAFPGKLLAHVVYEKDLTAYMQQKEASCECLKGMDMNCASMNMLYMYLQVLHDDYLKQKRGKETDTKYIMEAANAVVQCFVGAFERKERQPQTLEGLIGVAEVQIEQAANYLYANRY